MKKKEQMICPITYEALNEDEKYSKKGLKKLSPMLQSLRDFPLSAEQQRSEAVQRSTKMSIQGVQLKLSAIIDVKTQSFKICDSGGNYILKPQSTLYPELPENEDLSMRLASSNIEVPLHGLLNCVDGSFTYFIKRFDRLSKGKKLAVEDFSQLAGLTRDTKYNFSMEKIIPIIEKHCTFPALEKVKLFQRTIFNYLIGNEDMHLKNFSLICRSNKVELSPAYDYINTTIAIGNAQEEIALPLHGKKNNLTREDLVEYYGRERLGINLVLINEILEYYKSAIPKWKKVINKSFLSNKGKESYLWVVEERKTILKL